jgi:hypothetical protein
MSQEQMDRMVDSLHEYTAEEVAAQIFAESPQHNHQQPKERHCPPHDLEDKDTYFVCRDCRRMFPAEDVVGD